MIAPTPSATVGSDQLKLEFARTSALDRNLLGRKLDVQRTVQTKMNKQQLESMLMQAERAMSNEASSRELKQLNGKFALLQKIMQSMG